MGDFNNYGGSDEENAEIKRLNVEIVSYQAAVVSARGRQTSFECHSLT